MLQSAIVAQAPTPAYCCCHARPSTRRRKPATLERYLRRATTRPLLGYQRSTVRPRRAGMGRKTMEAEVALLESRRFGRVCDGRFKTRPIDGGRKVMRTDADVLVASAAGRIERGELAEVVAIEIVSLDENRLRTRSVEVAAQVLALVPLDHRQRVLRTRELDESVGDEADDDESSTTDARSPRGSSTGPASRKSEVTRRRLGKLAGDDHVGGGDSRVLDWPPGPAK
ncbi:hypothetical protein BH09MYX1_BH09MYX1_49870 [soil metagenome]